MLWEMSAKRAVPEIEQELETRVADLGFELVDAVWGGSAKRPLLKLRIDRLVSTPGQGVTVGECATVSRALEPWLDEHEALSERYVHEVSSPGVERPLVRARDFQRFRGEPVAINGHEVLAGRARRLEGELVGLDGDGTDAEAVILRLADGDEVRIPRSEIRKAHLVFTWK
jgi:ribosome maturation factor RimP